jgi:hypothetical protein
MLRPRGHHTTEASLLPKLRDHFAEFLNEGSHERLRILSTPTCVGLWYGHLVSRLEVFLGSLDSGPSQARRLTPLQPRLKGARIYLDSKPTHKSRDNQRPAPISFYVTPSR